MMVVDDEEIIREGISQFIEWEEYGIRVCATAANGRQALEMAEKFCPDLVLTDIKMPYMSGIELLKNLKKMNSDISVVILSGFSDFALVQEALQLGAADYILKPIDNDDLIKCILRARDIFIQNREKRARNEELLKVLQESLPALKEKFLLQLIHGEISDIGNIKEKIAYLQLPLQGNYFRTLVFHIDEYLAADGTGSSFIQKELTDLSIVTALYGALSGLNAYVFNYKSNEFVVLLSAANPADMGTKNIMDLAYRMQKNVQAEISASVTVGVSKIQESITGLQEAYLEASTAVKYKIVYGKGQIISIEDVEPGVDASSRYPFEIENEITLGIKVRDKEQIESKLNEFFDAISSGKDYKYIQTMCMTVYIVCQRTLLELNENMAPLFKAQYSLENINRFESLEEMKAWMKDTLFHLVDKLEESKGSKNRKSIEDIISYLNEHYAEDINLNLLSERYYMSPCYISLLFKKETGENLMDFLTKIRIEKSKQLLRNTNLKVYEICDKIGYNDSHYFTKLFKKYTGLNPTEYRNYSA